MKTCSKCGEIKEFSEFYKDKLFKDGHKSECIQCRKLRYQELKFNPIKQLEKQARISIMIENKLLVEKEKRLCSGCKKTFKINELLNNKMCKSCMKEYRIKKDLNTYSRDYRRNKKLILKDKDRREKLSYKEYHKQYMKEYRLKKKLEKLQQN